MYTKIEREMFTLYQIIKVSEVCALMLTTPYCFSISFLALVKSILLRDVTKAINLDKNEIS